MVKMSSSQEQILEVLRAAKHAYDETEEAFKLQVAQAREERMAPIRAAVAAATRDKIPASRIYRTLGFEQPAPYDNFMRNPLQALLLTASTGQAARFEFKKPLIEGKPELVSDTADEPDAYPTGRYITKWKRANGEPMNKVIVYAYMPDHDELTFRGATVWEQGITDVDEQDAIDGAMLEYLTRRYGRDDFVNVKIEK